MNSVQQTILGLVLVGIAFIFGSYLHRDGDQQSENQLTAGTENLEWQEHSVTDAKTATPPSTKAIPKLGTQRTSMPQLVEANLVPDLGNQATNPPEKTMEIVEPDFSRFALNDSVEDQLGTPPPPPMQTAQPDFESHFPPSPSRELEEIQPVQPERDLLANQGPATIRVTPKRLELNTQEVVRQPEESRNVLRQPYESPNGTIRSVETITVVTPIQPRNSSPVMMNTQNYLDHKTVAGETLQQLAVRYFGDSTYYLDIYVANKNVLQDPSKLPAGTRLRIPVYK